MRNFFKRFKVRKSEHFYLYPDFHVWYVAGTHVRILEIDMFYSIIELPFIWFGIPCKIVK